MADTEKEFFLDLRQTTRKIFKAVITVNFLYPSLEKNF